MTSSLGFRPEINGLRAIAVLLVIIFHLEPDWIPFGYVGVDIFFVISGYLITRIILRKLEDGSFGMGDFCARRIQRIFPALFVMLIVSVIVAILILSNKDYNSFCRSLRYAFLQAGNFFFEKNSGYFDLESKYQALLHTWSLGVEEQFYLVWPLLLLLAHKLKVSRVGAMVIVIPISLGGMVYFQSIESLKGFYMFYCRAWEFALGAILATRRIQPIRSSILNEIISFVGFALVAISLVAFSAESSTEVVFLISTCVGVCLLIYSSQEQKTLVSRMLSLKPLLFIGAISYSLYLWHWPVITFYHHVREFHAMSEGRLESAGFSWVDRGIMIVLFSALSMASYKWVEVPFRYAQVSKKRVIVVGCVFMVFGAIFAKFAQKQAIEPWRVKSFSNEFGLADLTVELGDYDQSQETPQVLVVGDSHAEHFTPMIEEWARLHQITTATYYRGGTPPLAVHRKFQDLLSYREQLHVTEVRLYLESQPNISHVIIAGQHESYLKRPNYLDAFSETIDYLVKRGTQVAILAQTPPLDGFKLRYIEPTHFMHWLYPRKMSVEELTAFNPTHQERALKPMRDYLDGLAQKHPSLYIWHPEDYLKQGSQKGVPLYMDATHLNLKGSLYFLPHFEFSPPKSSPRE
ncbi:acyltransferase [Akkermansiaceae bacterium]|nr:acyltransferase [Akkermansiaceae bacterium]MDB4284060.1 acyltransferase [Akkermansiaceae bacterium]MDC1448397.1 acyltransferase [bacterium]